MTSTTDKPETISLLRARMIEDVTVRNLVPATQREYIRAVKKLATFLRRPPDTATAEELLAFQIHLNETGTRDHLAKLNKDVDGSATASAG